MYNWNRNAPSWVNPLNRSSIMSGGITCDINAKLPTPAPFNPELITLLMNSGPSVPNQFEMPENMNVPLLDILHITLKNKNYFVCADGTILDVKNKKVIYDPSTLNKLNWNKMRILHYGLQPSNDWNSYGNPYSYLDAVSGLSKSDRDYWDKMNKEFAELSGTIAILNAELLNDLYSGKITKPTSLVIVDESIKR